MKDHFSPVEKSPLRSPILSCDPPSILDMNLTSSEMGKPSILVGGRMIVDLTEIETDSFDVDMMALKSSSYSQNQNIPQQNAIIMRDGKVRRRLKWKPKSMMKLRPRLPHNLSMPLHPTTSEFNCKQKGFLRAHSIRGRLSSSSSVNSSSNASDTSKHSRRSLHSFASVETQVKSNTSTSILQRRRFPLPRPNYSTTLDDILTKASSSSSNTATITTTTIANEGHALFSKSNKGTQTLDEERVVTLIAIDTQVPNLTNGQRPPLSQAPSFKPPLLPRVSSASSVSGRIPKPQSVINCEMLVASTLQPHVPLSTPSSLKSSSSVGDSNPLPTLSGEELELDRRVDLRIVQRKSMSASLLQKYRSANSVVSPSPSTEGLRTTESIAMDEISNSPKILVRQQRSLSRLSQTSTSSESTMEPVIGTSFNVRELERNETLRNVSKVKVDDIPVEELRFSVTNHDVSAIDCLNDLREAEELSTTLRQSPSRSPHSVPVDLDDCSFLEAEKNLQAIHDMAIEHLQQGENDEALDVFEEILRGQLTRYGKEHYRVATALHNIGVVHMRRGDYIQATKAYRDAVVIRKKALTSNHPDVAASLAQLGVAYLERRLHKKAIAAFQEALKIRREYLGNTHSKISTLLNNIGCSLYELDALEVAQVAFEEALDIQRKNLSQEPSDNQVQSNFLLLSAASTLSNIASIKLYFGNYDEASIDFQEALLIQQCVFGDDHPLPKHTEASLKWIDDARCSTSSIISSESNAGIFSKLWRRSSSITGAEELEIEITPSILTCSVPGEARDVFGFEQRLKALQDNIDLACGQEQKFENDDPLYDDDDDDDDYEEDEFY